VNTGAGPSQSAPRAAARPGTRPVNSAVGDGAIGGGDPTVLERWLSELERLDAVLAAQADYLDAVEHGESAAPPQPFIGTPGMPALPVDLTPYARDLVQRNADVTTRAMALSAQLRPRHQRPMHAPAPSRGTRFEQQA
jgi:hypothetical protein